MERQQFPNVWKGVRTSIMWRKDKSNPSLAKSRNQLGELSADQLERRLLPPEAAAVLGLNPDQVMTRVRSGKIRAVNIASKQSFKCLWRIRQSDLDAYQAGTSEVPMFESLDYKPPPERYRTMGPVNEQHFTLREVAEAMRVSVNHVYRLVESGCLLAVDVSLPGAKRKAWRIRESDWRTFEDSRLNRQWPKQRRGRRYKKPEGVIEFY